MVRKQNKKARILREEIQYHINRGDLTKIQEIADKSKEFYLYCLRIEKTIDVMNMRILLHKEFQ